MDIVHNAGYTPAKYLSRLGLKSMKERGRMQEGMIADITIFNPKTISDKADMKIRNRATQPKGIPHVLVSGNFVVRDGKSIIRAVGIVQSADRISTSSQVASRTSRDLEAVSMRNSSAHCVNM
jgi:N-acyl-D-aspartate/D-glutamate deacylase